MIKILFVITQLYKGGAEISLINLLNHLDYDNYDVDLLILNQGRVDNTVSLIDKVNKNVHVCNAFEEYAKNSLKGRINAKLIYTPAQKGAYLYPALDFVRNKDYEWAFFVGEWASPSFVAYEVSAKHKAAWIHSDISLAPYFDADHYFYFADQFDRFIFVSENSLKESVKAYPFIEDKAVVIYNLSDIHNIKEMLTHKIEEEIFKDDIPTLLTVANVRTEKNHLRQLKVMKELQRRGVDLRWINIGSTAHTELVNEVKRVCEQEKLNDKFILLGPRDNPYKYMNRVDAVTVLSDFESWSMVITEAKIVGVPVIATKTSGALEQLVHKETGMLTDFTVEDIADKIEEFIRSKNLQSKIRTNLKNFNNLEEVIASFNQVVNHNGSVKKEGQRILYVIDDVNFISGAQKATILQINELIKKGKNVTVYSNTVPNIVSRHNLQGVSFISWREVKTDVLFNTRLLNVLTSSKFTPDDKKIKSNWTKKLKLHKSKDLFMHEVLPGVVNTFSKYDVICVMSEASAYREAVSKVVCKKKIQWIHTDYCGWIKRNAWAKEITKDDGDIYKEYNHIVLLTEKIKDEFINLYPHLENKVVVSKNLMPVDQILKKAEKKDKNNYAVKFVSVGRLDRFKGWHRLLHILGKLKEEGYGFEWSIIGDGEEHCNLQQIIAQYDMSKNVKLLGYKENPFVEIRKAEVFALLSEYEGLPNTIYEAMILGIPVLATNVGGISSQINDGVNGWIAENDEDSIREKIKYLLCNHHEVKKATDVLSTYQYENDVILNRTYELFEVN